MIPLPLGPAPLLLPQTPRWSPYRGVFIFSTPFFLRLRQRSASVEIGRHSGSSLHCGISMPAMSLVGQHLPFPVRLPSASVRTRTSDWGRQSFLGAFLQELARNGFDRRAQRADRHALDLRAGGLFNQCICTIKQCGRYSQAKQFGGVHVNNQLELGRLLNR